MAEMMTAPQIQALLDRIDFSKFGIRIEIRLMGVGSWSVCLGFTMRVNSVDTGEPILASRTFEFPASSTEERMIRGIRDYLRWMVCHEVDECFEVDGVRVFDPHPKTELAAR